MPFAGERPGAAHRGQGETVLEFGNDARFGPASKAIPGSPGNEEKRRIFDETLRAWRRQLTSLQEKLSGDLVSLALANRKAIAGDPLDWVPSRLEEFWAARRPGFRNWPAVGCDPPSDPNNPDADLAQWHAPAWMLGQLPPFALPGLDAMAAAESDPPPGRLPLIHTTEILNSIAARIEMALFRVARGVLDRATIVLASGRVRARGEPSKKQAKTLLRGLSAISGVYGEEWNRLWIDSTMHLYEGLAGVARLRGAQRKAQDRGTALRTRLNATNTEKSSDCHSVKWEDIQIIFLSDHRIQISTQSLNETLNYAEMGFIDDRNKTPNTAWKALRELAESGGRIRTGSNWSKVEKRMQEIRKVFREQFGISDDPLPFVKGTGYRARFKISCAPSYQT
jgi:hypothetical protein